MMYLGEGIAGKPRSSRPLGAKNCCCHETPDSKKPAINAGFMLDLVGRGNLNRSCMLLILITNKRLKLFLEYLLEYR